MGFVDPYTSAGRVHGLDVLTFGYLVFSSSLALTQCIIYPHDDPSICNLLSWSFLFLTWLAYGIVEGYFGIYYRRLDWVFVGALLKAGSTIIKYAFQIHLNYTKKCV